eukprot:scaffold46165_cov127-Cyclotella_meneghiniana.AAC.2
MRCKDEGRMEMFEESVGILADFLAKTHMYGRLVDCIVTYLVHCGEQSMSSIHLLNITHRQWLYCNARIHLLKAEGLTSSEHEDIFNLVKDIMLVDPADLLPRHRHLLEQDYKQLGEGSTMARKLWLQKMRSAVSAEDITARRDGGPRRRFSSLSSMAAWRYDDYRREAGIDRTRRSNLAKRGNSSAAPAAQHQQSFLSPVDWLMGPPAES